MRVYCKILQLNILKIYSMLLIIVFDNINWGNYVLCFVKKMKI